jgi:hypothetical protein
LAGYYENTDLNLGTVILPITSSRDGFRLKFESNFNLNGGKKITGASGVNLTGMAVHNDHGVYVCGYLSTNTSKVVYFDNVKYEFDSTVGTYQYFKWKVE